MVAIILCTYNGECFIEKQLQSLQNQTYKDLIVYIHDDGSTDSTVQLIESFKTTSSLNIVIMNDETKHRGAGPSFMWALNNVTADYYMFCDQDDYWLPTKVEHTYNRMLEVEKCNQNNPVLIHTDLSLTDDNLNITHESFWNYQNFKVDISKKRHYISFGNIVTGCTMIINNAAKQVAFPYDGVMLHDYWIALRVAKYGIIENIKEQTILYRQHGNNEAGAGTEYNKYSIGFAAFFKQLTTEVKCFNDITGAGVFSWFYHRLRYFYHRHLK